MAQPSKEDILRKLKGLKAIADGGGSESEMQSAAEILARWLMKYNVELNELDDSHADVLVELLEIDGKYNETWRKRCYGAAAKLYLCSYFSRSRQSKERPVTHSIVGEAHNLAAAGEMGRYFEATINRLANASAKAEAAADGGHTNRHRFIRTFRLTAAERLNLRVQEFVDAAKAGKALDPETGTTMPALQSLYDRQEDLYAAWLETQDIEIVKVERRDQITHRSAATLGRAAGDSISLSTQLSPEASVHLLPGS